MIRQAAAGVMLAIALAISGPAGAVARDATVDQLIVRFKDSAPADGVRAAGGPAVRVPALPDGRTPRFARRLGSGSVVYRLPVPMSRNEALDYIAELSGDASVQFAQIDERVRPAYVPADAAPLDSLFNLQWYLHDSASEPFSIDMVDAWDVSLGAADMVIAVLDTGYVSHEDLDPGRLLPGYDFISSVTTANDGNGRDDSPLDPGDWVAAGECGTNDPPVDEPSSWHGLLVTGLIAAESENYVGIEGIDFLASILPVRVLGKCGGHVSDIVDAMRWTVGETSPSAGSLPLAWQARVVNLSFSTEAIDGCPPEEQAAIDFVRAAGAVVITAAGNEGGSALDHSPGNCQGVINVGASTRSGELAGYSNSGTNLDFVAPGGSAPLNPDGVLTLSNGGLTGSDSNSIYVYSEGTSFTAAQASGVAGLILAVNPLLTPDQVANILCATAVPLAACPSACGTGLMDANAALTMAQDSVTNIGVIPANSCPSETVNVGSSIFVKRSGGGGGCVAGPATDRPDPLFAAVLPLLAWFARRRFRAQGR